MKLLPVLAIFFAGVLAAPPPGSGYGGDFDACRGVFYSVSRCCSAGILDIADVDCENPTNIPTSIDSFKADCASIGKRARCCSDPFVGVALLCRSPYSS
ncbi:uncharacterized protein FPOAC1_013484 [Fusarium poae]|jgi:hypothetical protein|uniref:Hydrophobin n=1 Tax=Fusarium poae TaxID=36050 RepID=A0A1B8AA64_FUSPO|nr:uncharacterized protein FPOAC1_013484 [Fusarium poae]KAG8664704.1 hypothetical protein FPOAC1_013484 [Fusarium poae]OBS16423.1 hypothetical protein FPOA_12925 [Fusarium poae]OBS17367.1 hypothetical protein FPOA_12146 [Fusarium poae]OBS17542.1 hypothetical protein FPOA_12030 [Fusarium poae]